MQLGGQMHYCINPKHCSMNRHGIGHITNKIINFRRKEFGSRSIQ